MTLTIIQGWLAQTILYLNDQGWHKKVKYKTKNSYEHLIKSKLCLLSRFKLYSSIKKYYFKITLLTFEGFKKTCSLSKDYTKLLTKLVMIKC